MQRILSLATLVGLGAAVWMFLSGGGLNQLAVDPHAPASPSGGFGGATSWNGSGAFPSYGSSQPLTPAGVQPAAVGSAAPPRDNGPTIKIASFNIEVFGTKKLEDQRIAYTLARIVQLFDVVAIQEIRTTDEYHLDKFVQLINSSGRRYSYVPGPRLGNTQSKEQYAFIFDAAKIAFDPNSAYTVGDPENLLHREPLVATFSTGVQINPDEAFTFTLINVHTDPDAADLRQELDVLAEVYRAVRRAGGNEDDVIMLGDFNASDLQIKQNTRLGQIPDLTPLVRGVYSNARQSKLYDNIIVHLPSTTEYVGRSGVYNLIREANLSVAEAEMVSDHFPVWAEFSAYERDYAFRVVSRRTMAR